MLQGVQTMQGYQKHNTILSGWHLIRIVISCWLGGPGFDPLEDTTTVPETPLSSRRQR
jgi:hypothetical protein